MPHQHIKFRGRQKLQDCATYPNMLNLTTMLAALPPAQFAIPEVNLDAAQPDKFPDFERMIDLLISHHIVPIITLCYTRNDFTPVEYDYTRRMNLAINGWDVPSVNFLGAVDDGTVERL